MYSFPNLEPAHCSMSVSNCCFLTYIQISQEADQIVWCSHPLKDFPQFVVIHTVKGFGIVKKQKQMFFWNCLAFSMIQRLLAIWSLAFCKSSLNVWKFTVHILLKPGLENFEHYFASVWDECIHAVVWKFFGNAFLWDWNENLLFPVLWPLLSFPNLLAYWVEQFHSIIFQDLK